MDDEDMHNRSMSLQGVEDEPHNQSQSEQQTTDSQKKKKKPRGPSKGLKSMPEVPRVLEWDELCRPIGKWAKAYKTHLGEISRAKVSILALSDLLDTVDVASIGFMCPEMISETYLHSDANRILLYMTHVMEKQKSKQFILCPYHEKNHWVLLVLCMAKREVIIFDSLRQKRNLVIKFAMTNAFRSFKALSGQSRGSKLTWHLGQCPQQLGGRECGYYVMRYMYEILEHHAL
ncbi:uncharacterized protein LOC110713755 [Chenopodium quinoa]|uniref:uncharacterized protein LOC110713755 n=1 Tax=Chenopodium quinoa TaxID=63459 RepID=UPI000B772FE8|nr:uncharacterized protein LOC110713755 [Chenopodium quinoa]